MRKKITTAGKNNMEILSGSQIRAVLDTAVEGIITIDHCGTIMTFNKAANKLFGYELSEVKGQNVSMLMPSPYREQHDEYIESYARTGKKKIIGIGREVVGKRKDGSVFPLYLSVAESRVGEVITYTGIVRDLTETKKMEQDLREKEEELARYDRRHTLGEMASSIAHEINQPLAAITTYAQACSRLLESEEYNKTEVMNALEEISKQAERAGSVIRSLRNMSKGQSVERDIVNINYAIRDILPVIRAGAKGRHILVEERLAAGELEVEINTIQIQQVVLNLANNALDASKDHSTIIISSSLTDKGDIEVTVEDKGQGVEQSTAEKMFHPYFTTKSKGTGMGLTICESIIVAHQGKLGYRPGSAGGAVFYFTLPACG